MTTLGERIIEWLEAYDVDTVFGIPGVHTVELYRGLATSSIHHVTPRHEQGAGFMADGYARVTGKPGVAFVITGPGVTNILTPMAQAYADSIPMLVISAVNRRSALGLGAGDLHEVRNQSLIAAQASAFSHTLSDPAQLPQVLARAWAVFDGARPRPVHIEVPLDMLSEPTPAGQPVLPSRVERPDGAQANVARAVEKLREAKRPLILAGGGAQKADIASLAGRLDAPVVMTINGRGALGPGHPLAVPASPALEAVREAIAGADVVLAVGTEFGRTDYDQYDRSPVEIPGTLIRIDIDPEQIHRGAQADLPIVGDAAGTVDAVLENLGDRNGQADGAAWAAKFRAGAYEEIGEKYRTIVRFLDSLRDTLPEAPIISDSTQGAYAGNLYYAAPKPGKWFGAATGYGALGYGLPAAIGAARGLGAPVICLAGDGGLQFSLTELGAAVEEQLPVILIVWNNQGYGEIKDYMISNQIAPVGVDLHTPDFVAIGKAYGAEAMTLERLDDLPGLLTAGAARKGPTLIEIDEAIVLQ